MPNPAPTYHPVHELIGRRWSPHAFTNAPVTGEQMRSLFEAARWAPSSRNEQPWSFLVALREDEGQFARFFGCLMPGNQLWAGGASALLLSVAEARRADGSGNRYAVHDTALAVANLALQATSMDLYTHHIGGFDASKARVEFGIPETHDPVAMMAIGHFADADTLPEDLRDRERQPRVRKRLGEFVYGGAWGEPADLLS
jgi:nitroreductase